MNIKKLKDFRYHVVSLILRAYCRLVRAFCGIVPRRIRAAYETQSRCLAYEERAPQIARDFSFLGRAVASVEQTPANESELIVKLADSFNAAKKRQLSVSKEYLPSHEWKRILESEWSGYFDPLLKRDVKTLAPFLRNFLRKEGASGFWGGTKMFENFLQFRGVWASLKEEMIMRQFAAWRAAFPTTPVAELGAPPIGNPWGYNFSGTVVLEPAFEYHFQADYFRKLLCDIDTPTVLEIGGGFGGLAFHLLRRDARVKYIGLDLPENILLQSYYLHCAFPGARILTYDEHFSGLDRRIIKDHDVMLLPNFVLPEIESSTADLIINVRSLSEMATETIAEYFHQIDRVGRLFFFHENIFAPRRDELWGVPSSQFPALENFCMIASSESRWPKYKEDSDYPCKENLFIHRNVLRQSRK
ncbi:MAG: putative sugar O-methyltransferase [Verrucomicrobiota bacterium]|jgi:putative sugar O-methyltransferase